jgi:hemerythrin
MKWSETYATGIAEIDEQHKTIFNMTGDFRAALDEGQGEGSYGLLLEFLERYCRGHFDFEERCMEEYRCPAAQQNKDAHVRFDGVLAGFRQRYAASGYRLADARELLDVVEQWLSNHICGVDIHLKNCVKGKGPAP